MTWTTPLGPNAHLRAVRANTLRTEQATTLARIAQETSATIDRPSRATAAGDQRKLRGIPAIGRGVPGCIPGTSPHGRNT